MDIDLADLNDGLDTVIFSSASGPRHAPAGAGRKAYCVGETTTQVAQSHGWNATCVGENADTLVRNLSGHKTPLTHLSGTKTRGNIAPRLTAAHIPTQQIPIYDQVAQHLSDDAQSALSREKPIILPLFSPATALQFRLEYQGATLLYVLSLSDAVAHELQGLPVAHMQICTHPTRQAMLGAVQNALSQVPMG